MAVKILILGAEKGLDNALRDGLDRHEDALFDRVLGEQTAVAGMHAGDRGRLVGGELAVVRQVATERPQHIDYAGDAERRQSHHEDQAVNDRLPHAVLA